MMPLPSWSQVRLLGYYSLLRNAAGEMEPGRTTELRNRIKAMADRMIRDVEVGVYHTVMGSSARDFIWGSNSVAANQGIALIQAYRITHDKKYLAGALSNLDYLLGRNATGYSFITGYGDKTPMHIHHRPSASDDIAEPIPGLLAGGPNPGKQDKCSYPSSTPDEAYVDDVCSYASNEVAINWNAPFVYLAAAMEVLQNESKVNGN
jgi:endoglucanase